MVAISDGVRAALIASGVEPAHIHLVPSGVEAERFAVSAAARAAARARFALADDRFVLAVVGALEARKGHDVLLDALATLADPARRRARGRGGRRARRARGARPDARARRDGPLPRPGRRRHVRARRGRRPGDALAARRARRRRARGDGGGTAGDRESRRWASGSRRRRRDRSPGAARRRRRRSPRQSLRSPPTARSRAGSVRRGRARVRARFTMAGMAAATLAVYRRLAESNVRGGGRAWVRRRGCGRWSGASRARACS